MAGAPGRVGAALFYWGPALAVAAVIWLFSSIPGPYVDVLLFPHSDKVAHFIAFGALGAMLIRALDRHVRLERRWACAAAVLLVLAYGVVDEWHQHYVPRRSVEVLDVVADALGGAAACWVWYLPWVQALVKRAAKE